ncbi:MAG TPA: tetratricopeptide repeat protein, partial [Telluria sp.]|nr:tetratricopeptide repeat protein [Telluria sp.]
VSLKQAEAMGPFPRNLELLTSSLNMLASLTDVKDRYSESIRYRKRALDLQEKYFGPNDGQLCVALINLAKTYDAMGKRDEAERALERSVAIRAKADPRTLPSSLIPLGAHYEAAGKLTQAEATYQRLQALYEQRGGPNNPALQPVLERLAAISAQRGNAAQAKALAARAAKLSN